MIFSKLFSFLFFIQYYHLPLTSIMQEINIAIFHFFNNLSQYSFIQKIVFIFADLPIFFVPVFLLWAWFYYTYKEKNISLKEKLMFLFYGCVLSIIFALVIQQFIHLDRPETAITNSGKLLLKHIPDASFPSDHATVSFAFLMGLFFLWFKKSFYYILPFVILMNISRVIAGVHWPFDIIVGWLIGTICAYIAVEYLTKIKFVKTLNSFIIKILSSLKL